MSTPSPEQEKTARLERDPTPSSRPGSRGEQFAPGTIVSGRYRISGILGSGGMGEVYRADDTKLDQQVALKFLSARLARDPLLLGRLHEEVRLGRQIAHPNVCRIYDIVEWENAHFVAMEYVDGEDLSRLLHRIGRIAHDKAVEITRGIAAGLMGAHAKGILHRDLKPANVMIDSHGEARITDFGLALSATEDQTGDVSGTPAYMAPEQIQGAPATVQSDLYALGLVMYELFTGKRAHAAKTLPDRLREITSEITVPSNHLRDIDPAVERVILRCLSSDPAQRPRSARDVIEALPGGDPLAAAMAAGETPSPRVVAAAGAEGTLHPGVAWSLLTVAVVFAGVSVLALRSQSVSQFLPLDRSPVVLHDRAQSIARDLGVPLNGKPVTGIYQRLEYVDWLAKRDPDAIGEAFRRGPGPVLFRIEHGVSPAESALEPLLASAPGRTSIDIDTAGRLSFLLAAPADDFPPKELDWNRLLAAAGLSTAVLKPIEPRHAPPVPFDARAAWTGTYPGDRIPIAVEAAAWHGVPVFFRVTGEWEPRSGFPTAPAPALFFIGVTFVLMTLALLLAWRNFRLRRGDRTGATRAAVVMAGVAFLSAVLRAQYPSGPLETVFQIVQLITNAVGTGFATYIAYLAIEPYMRRRWPDRLIAWSRLLAGRFRDPMVGRDVLIGVAGGAVLSAISATGPLVARLTSSGSQAPDLIGLPVLLGLPNALSSVLGSFSLGAFLGFFCMALLVIASMVLRNRTAAGAVLFLVILAGFLLAESVPLVSAVAAVALVTWLPYRYGLLATVALFTTNGVLFLFPHLAVPWATSLAVVAYAAFAILAFWSFRTSLGGQNAFGNLADDA